MKKFIITLLMIMLCVSTALFTISCDKVTKPSTNKGESSLDTESVIESESVFESESETGSEKVDDQSFIEFKTLTVDGLTVYGKVSNETTTFSFINEIRTDKNCKYEVSLDIYGVQLVISKTIALNVGDNVVYIIEFKNDEPINLYTVTIRRRPLYRVTFNTDGGSAVATQYVEEDFLATQPTTEKVGYDFVSWNYNFNEPITRDTAIVASWSAHTDTKYTVNYYLQNLDDNNYTLHETVELTGTTDTTARANINEYTHFTFNQGYYYNKLSGNVNGDGSQVLSVYYARDRYTISTTRNNAKAGTITSGGTYRFDKQITLIATTNAGYAFLGWYDGETLVCKTEEFTFKVEKDVTYTATWSANTDTKYTVNYYWQNLDDDEYTLHETVELKGETDTTATADIKEYTHFTYNASKSTVSGNINGDGSQVLSVYYTRDKYTISTARNNTKAGTVAGAGSYKFDKEITLTATINAGYTFLGWYDGETLACATEEFTFNAEKNVTYTATWSANKDTKYTVNYYWQNIDDDNYTLHETVELKGETDTTATADIKKYTRFTYNASKSTVSGNINGDGSRILSVYYTRDKYVISTARNNTKAGTVAGAGSYKFDKEITLTATTNAGYTFLGWYDGETLVCETEEFTFNAEKNVTCTATWFTHTDTVYTVIYYLQNLEDNNYTPYETLELTGETDTTATAEIKTFEHFTYNRNKSTVSGNINGDGSRILSVYYTRNTYTLTINNSSLGSITNAGNYKYGAAITTTATPHLGYTFVGWYEENELLSTDNTYTFVIDKNISVTASFAVKDEMSNFNFTSTATTCLITGLKDKTVTEIIVPDYVTSIGDRAFYACDSLTSVVIPDSVTSIGEDAFEYCFKLVEVVNKSTHFTVTKGSAEFGDLGYYALAVYNSGDEYISKLSNDGDYIIYTDGAEKILVGYKGAETDLVLPSYITKIYEYAFYSCDSLASVVIGDGVTSIGVYAFKYCDSLTSVVIGDSVTSIGKYAFEYCFQLVEVVNKSTYFTVTKGSKSYGYLGYYALAVYNSGSGITESQLLNDNGYIIYTDGDEKILISYNGAETDLVLPSYITKIYRYAFQNCDSLTSAEIPDSVTSIGNYAFASSYSLTSVVIGDNVTSIGDSAFYDCDSLTSVVIGDSVTSIGDSAFVDCYKLVEVVNKSTHFTVTKGSAEFGYLGYYALAVYNSGDAYISKLSNDGDYIIYTDGAEKILVGYNGAETDLVLPSYITKINQNAFYDCDSLTSVVIGDSVTSIGEYAFYYCYSLTSVVIPDSVTSIGEYAFALCGSLTSVVIGNGVTSIGDSAFYDCSSLTSVVIPDSVTNIGSWAFRNCSSLTSIVIPDSVTSIGYYAFYGCNSLTSVVIGDSVTSIGVYAFYYCSKMTSVVIGDSVTSIGYQAFYGCRSLTSVVIGDGVTTIGEDAFYKCNSLTSVYFKGTPSEWSGISIGSYNTNLTNATRYYYSETEPTASGNYWHYDEDGTPVAW